MQGNWKRKSCSHSSKPYFCKECTAGVRTFRWWFKQGRYI